MCLDVKPLSVAVQEYRPKEIAEKTYDVLKELHDRFDGLVPSAEDSDQVHPNQRDSKLVIQAVYVLNDIALGAVVGDEEVGKEGAELLKVMDDLAKLPGSKIDVAAVKTFLDRLCVEKDKQRVVLEEIKPLLDRQLKELLSPAAGN
jgi:hypothetical protein